MSQVQFLYGTKQAYQELATKNNNTLYFLTDTFEIYKGDSLYTCSYEVSTNSSQVNSPKENYLYVFTDTAQLAIFNGSYYEYLTPAVSSADITTAAADNIPTVGAVQLIVQTLQNAIKANAANVNANAQSIAENKKALDILNGDASVEGSIANITAGAVAEIVGGADDGFDTLKDIANWITSDTTGAAGMANDISDIKKVLGINSSSGSTGTSDSLITRVTNTETELDSLTALVTDSSNVNSIEYRLTQAERDIDTLEARPNGMTVSVNDGTTTTTQKASWTLSFVKSDYAGHININGIPVKIVDLSGFASSDKLTTEITRVENLFSNYYTKTDIIGQGFATTAQLNAQIATINEKFKTYYTKDESDEKFLTAEDLEAYALKTEVQSIASTTVSGALENYALKTEVSDTANFIVNEALKPYALTSSIRSTASSVVNSALQNLESSGKYLTSEQASTLHAEVLSQAYSYTDTKISELGSNGSGGGTNATWESIS